MTIILKPCGRGNWSTARLEIKGAHVQPMLFRAGQLIWLAGVKFRICEVIN